MSRPLFETLKAACATEWAACVDHAFVRALGDGSLPEACFRRYLGQDYLFLAHFAHAYGLAATFGQAAWLDAAFWDMGLAAKGGGL